MHWLVPVLAVTIIGLSGLMLRAFWTTRQIKEWAESQHHRALQAEQRAERLEQFDSMTSLPKRKLFEDYLQTAIHQAFGDRNLVGVGFAEITDFNKIQQIAGFAAASKLVRSVADQLLVHVNETVYVSHFGNGKFGLIVGSVESRTTAYNTIHKILGEAEVRVEADTFPVDVNLSCGLAFFPDDGADHESITRAAEIACSFSSIKRSSLVIYDKSMEPDPRQLALMPELRDAIRADILGWVFQPILDLKTQRVESAEMLVRWNHPIYGPIAPDLFIPKAEESGVINELTRHVVKKASEFCRDWDRRQIHISIAINVSGNDLSDPKIVEAILHDFHDMGDRVILEVTETAIMRDIESIIANVHKLRTAGVHVALDNYGVGDSSLFHVRRLRLDKLKINRHLINTLCESEEDEKIVDATIRLAHELDAEVIAEGVEDARTLEKLKELGCDAAQGYYIAAPMPAYEFVHFYNKSDRP